MGKEFVVKVPHKLGTQEATSRIKGLVEDLKQKFGADVSVVHEKWTDNRCEFSLRVKRFDLSGSIRVLSSSAEIRGRLPLAARVFEGKAKQIIEEHATKLLS